MKYARVRLEAIGWELPPEVVTSAELEARLAPVYRTLRLEPGQLEAFTGIRERRWWEPGFRLSEGAARAARKALAASRVAPADVGALLYTGVCRENFEPATACAVAEALGVRGGAAVHDLSNACLGVLDGIVEVANRIELGQMAAGLVVSCESAREINEIALARMLERPEMEAFKDCLATLTGGSGAVAVLLSDGSFGRRGPRLLGGVHRAAPEHHRICRWGLEPAPTASEAAPPRGSARSPAPPGAVLETMRTDAVAVLRHGVTLGKESWEAFLAELGWSAAQVDRVVCHQVGSAHQRDMLAAFGLPPGKDFTSFEHLGNMGTVSLPLTAALAEEREVLAPGDRVGWLGIGSGLNCLMLGWEW